MANQKKKRTNKLMLGLHVRFFSRAGNATGQISSHFHRATEMATRAMNFSRISILYLWPSAFTRSSLALFLNTWVLQCVCD